MAWGEIPAGGATVAAVTPPFGVPGLISLVLSGPALGLERWSIEVVGALP